MFRDTSGEGGSRLALMGVDYDERHPESFRGLTLHLDGDEAIGPFRTLGEVADAAAARGYDQIGYLSSYDNFIADGGTLA